MSSFKEFEAQDISTNRATLNQLVDIIGTDISASETRRKFQVFVTGGVGPGVTSSLFQTVYDQDFTLQTANSIFDMTFGLHTGSDVVQTANPTIDANGKRIYPQETLMMREKTDVYRLFAQELLGDSNAIFTSQTGSNSSQIKEAMFVSFKRLFARDQIKRETFAFKYHPTASTDVGGGTEGNLQQPASASTKIITDINSAVNKQFEAGGQFSTLVDSEDTLQPLGMLFLDKGVAVIDVSRSFDNSVRLTGSIDAVDSDGVEPNFSGSQKFFLMSASLDDIIDHYASTRFKTGSKDETAITFQNITNIHSTQYFARVASNEFNYSSNPTYVDDDNRIVVIDEGQEENQRSFTFITSIGLYDANNTLLAVSKLSRPVLKDNSRYLTFKVRLDWAKRECTNHITSRNNSIHINTKN